MDAYDRFASADPSIDETRHDLVPLRIELSIGTGLRYAIGQLSAAQIVIRRDRDAFGADDFGLRRILPIDMSPLMG